MIINAHRSNVENIGDLLSSPLRYFDFPQKQITLDIRDEIKKIVMLGKIGEFSPVKMNLIIGGGGLLDNEYFEKSIYKLNNMKFNSIIYWGVGHNRHDDDNVDRLYGSTKEFLDKASLYGVRDNKPDYDFLPCVSCMHTELDKKHAVTNDIVIFEHEHIPLKIDDNTIPKMQNNNNDFPGVIKFLASANYVVTNSYHGMYWSMLMGKKVVCIPFSSKFELFPFDIPMGKETELDSLLQQTVAHDDALEQCRALNKRFYQKTLEII